MDKRRILPAPLFRDPIYDCPTDPTVIWNREEKQWYLFYTQRRNGVCAIGSSWVHGTKIGVASSADGIRWLYRGTLENLDIERGHNTFWAPEIIWAEGKYHMYVSYITGVPQDWNYPRKMLHYTSDDLWDWKFQSVLDLGSERVIDACVYEIAPRSYKMWYKDECADSRIFAAVSEDLYHWTPVGMEVSDCAQEGPNVFELGGKIWMVSDYWKGLAIYRSEDFKNWIRCEDILKEPGNRPMDRGLGHHADVLVKDGRAFLFYFCIPGVHELADGPEVWDKLPVWERNMAVVQAAELLAEGDRIVCNRDAEVVWE